jgi:hypothetical protein
VRTRARAHVSAREASAGASRGPAERRILIRMLDRRFGAALALLVAACGGARSADGARGARGAHPAEPPELLFTVAVRDPYATVARVARAAGVDPASAWRHLPDSADDPALRALFDGVDPHATWFLATTGPADDKKAAYTAAVRLRDLGATRRAFFDGLGGAVKPQAPFAGGPSYRSAHGEVYGFSDGFGVVGDEPASLEAIAPFAMAESEMAPVHDVALHVPLARHAEAIHASLDEVARKLVADEPEVAALFAPMLEGIVETSRELDSLDAFADLGEQDAVLEATVHTHGASAAWLARYPGGSASSVLSLPKGSIALLVRYPDELAAMVSRAVVNDAKTGNRRDVVHALRAFAATLGHEVALVLPSDLSAGDKEGLVRVELTDAPRAAELLREVTATWSKHDPSLTSKPFQRFGAAGASCSFTNKSGEAFTVVWAVRAPYLFLDVPRDGGSPALLNAALDPNAKGTLRSDPEAARIFAAVPGSGLVAAYYGAFEGKSASGWIAASAKGLSLRIATPVASWASILAPALRGGAGEADGRAP